MYMYFIYFISKIPYLQKIKREYLYLCYKIQYTIILELKIIFESEKM